MVESMNKLKVLKKIYEGQGSLVYKVMDEEYQKEVIIKILKKEFPNSDEIAKFKLEYKIMKQLNENVFLDVYDF